MNLNVAAALALGMMAWAGPAAAANPSRPGLTGPLGDELFYNYVEGYAGLSYLDAGLRNRRAHSDKAFGFNGSVFLFAPVYLLGGYDYQEFSYSDRSSGTTSSAALTRIAIETERTSVGLGVRIPVAFATDLFVNATYEQLEGFERARQSNVTTSRRSLDAEGAAGEAGVRSFISNFAELALSYRYRETRSDRRDTSNGNRREINKLSFLNIGLVVPVWSQLSLFARAEIGESDSSFSAADDQFEYYQLGARLNFRL